MSTSQKFSYINGSDADVCVIVEPWADQFLIEPGQRVEILVCGEGNNGPVEIEQLPTCLIIYCYEGCIISLLSDGEELACVPPQSRSGFPALPTAGRLPASASPAALQAA